MVTRGLSLALTPAGPSSALEIKTITEIVECRRILRFLSFSVPAFSARQFQFCGTKPPRQWYLFQGVNCSTGVHDPETPQTILIVGFQFPRTRPGENVRHRRKTHV